MATLLIQIFFIINILVFLTAIKKVKKEFYSDTLFLFPLGIYVWGDALILAPFWMLSSFIFMFTSEINILKYVLIFYIVRSFYEVFYWLNHQSVKSNYNPPLFRKIKWIKAGESSILYQLIHTCVVILGLFCFLVI